MWVLQIVKFRHATFAARKAAATNITCKTVLNAIVAFDVFDDPQQSWGLLLSDNFVKSFLHGKWSEIKWWKELSPVLRKIYTTASVSACSDRKTIAFGNTMVKYSNPLPEVFNTANCPAKFAPSNDPEKRNKWCKHPEACWRSKKEEAHVRPESAGEPTIQNADSSFDWSGFTAIAEPRPQQQQGQQYGRAQGRGGKGGKGRGGKGDKGGRGKGGAKGKGGQKGKAAAGF
jgi:uncharacterized membrane protein YgcG